MAYERWDTTAGARRAMQGNRSRDTRPEVAVRSAAHRAGLRFRVAARPLPAVRRTADLLFPRAQVAVFVDGCFWHACPAHFKPPRSRVEYWNAKIAGNQARDRDTDVTLRAAGWSVVRVWEHAPPEEAVAAIRQALSSRVA